MNFRFSIGLVLASLALFAGGGLYGKSHAAAPNWSQCPDTSPIARCETYNCPQGDTNKDGACTLDDSGASLSDSRNNSLCANPISGCGEVRYFKQNTDIACAIRVKESSQNCDLYSAGNPSFSTPTPVPTPTPTSTPHATFQPVATTTPTTKGSALPETGPEIFINLALIALGFLGIYLYERYRPA
jgi:hypothetical protein